MREPVVIVDARREGRHGIARFGREVVQRLRTPHRRLGGPSDALSPFDLVNPSRLLLRRSDLVYSPGFHCGPARVRQLVTLHDLIQLDDPLERDLKKTLYYRYVVRPAVLRAGRVLTVSETSRNAVRAWIDDAVPVADVGNGCSDVFFDTDAGLQRDGVLYVGNFKPHKNPAPAFAAVAGVPGLHLTVVTSDAADAERLAAEHGVSERTTVRSGISDEHLAGLYSRAGALLLPSLSEGFGLPAAEALAAGCPVVHWADCESVAEIVGEDGVAVSDPRDPVAWTAAVEQALGSRGAAEARERIRGRYSWDAVASRVDEEIGVLLR